MSISENDNTFSFLVHEVHPGAVGIDLRAGRYFTSLVQENVTETSELPTAPILHVDATKGYFSITPRFTLPNPPHRFLGPRYKRLEEVVIEGHFPDDDLPHDDASARLFIRVYTPPSFIHDPLYGLGIMKEMHPLITAIEELKGVTTLVISDRNETHLEENTFYLAREDYDALRAASMTVARHYQGESLEDRRILAHNATLHRAHPDLFPEKATPYRAGTVFKLLGSKGSAGVKLSPRDRAGMIAALSSEARKISRSEKRAAIQLQQGIELLNLNQLIAAFERRLSGSQAEKEWQDLFQRNPFILSMTLGYPITVLQPHAHAGGMTLQGNGNKIADFLAKTQTTHNAALIEIKTPKTELLGEEYRVGVFGPSRHLTGAVVQVLDQRRLFIEEIATLKHRSRIQDLEAHAVDCVIVAGRTPTEPSRQASFELIRHQYKDVTVLTFDELLEKLKLLQSLLAQETEPMTAATYQTSEDALDLTELLENSAEGDDDDFFAVGPSVDDEFEDLL